MAKNNRAALWEFDEQGYCQRLIDAGIDANAAASTAAKMAAARRTNQISSDGRATGFMQPSKLVGDLLGDKAPPPAAPEFMPPTVAKLTPKGTATSSATASQAHIFTPLGGDLTRRQKSLLDDALEIENEDAKKANAIGYMARTLAQATLPHTDPKIPLGQLYSRDSGRLTLIVAPTSMKHGIPYGTIPRMILAWICTEAVHTQDRTLMLGHSQSEFLEKIGMQNNGTDISRFKDQALRLFKSVISVEYSDDAEGDESARLLISSQSHVFWHPKRSEQRALWDSTLELSEDFAKEILAAPVPIDMRVLHALTKSPLAMDVYTWLTYRMFVLRRSGRPFVLIPWIGLKMQFGAGYADSLQGLADFKINFKKRLREVLNFYPEARSCIEDDKQSKCLKLRPAQLHIAHQKRPLSE